MSPDRQELLQRQLWSEALQAIQIRRGQVAVIAIDMAKVPLPPYPAQLTRDSMKQRGERWCAFVLEALMEQLGPDGTVIVPTFTYSCTSLGRAYVHESTPSEVGPFTEYLRRLPHARRSLHPLFSLAGVGRNTRDILDDVGKSAFGPASPFSRLAHFDSVFLCLGASFGSSVTYLHHLEHCHGCNHRFHKVLETDVYRGGESQAGPWLAYVRFRGTDALPNLGAVERRLRSEGSLREACLDTGTFQAAHLVDVDRVGYAMLAENPCAFVKHPVTFRLDDHAIVDENRTDTVLTLKLTFDHVS